MRRAQREQAASSLGRDLGAEVLGWALPGPDMAVRDGHGGESEARLREDTRERKRFNRGCALDKILSGRMRG